VTATARPGEGARPPDPGRTSPTARGGAATVGVVLAAAGAACYGLTVVLGRHLATKGMGAGLALGCRFALAAVFLAVLLRLRRVPIRPPRGEALKLLALGGLGYGTEALLFYLALEQGTAAAAILIFYSYPAIVCGVGLARGRERLSRSTALALGLSTAGTAVVVAAGGGVSITALGVVLAFSSALTYAVYLLVSVEVGARSDPMVAACWTAAGAAASSLLRAIAADELGDPTAHWLAMLTYGATTAAAFALTFAALRRIGASRAAVVMTLEAVTAAGLGALVLGEPLTAAQMLGGAAVLAAAVVIAWERPVRVRGPAPGDSGHRT
jgi:drug/metabolite transporter (DMT)-like permease